jgi:multidrug efflux pump
MSWTVIFGLTFATFLTLLLVPVMYLITVRMKRKIATWKTRITKSAGIHNKGE